MRHALVPSLLTLTAALALGCQPGEPAPDDLVELPPGNGDLGEWPGGSADDLVEEDGLRRHVEAGGGGGVGDPDADGAAFGGAEAERGEGPGMAPPPGEPEPGGEAGDVGSPGALEGGEIDDNALFVDYLRYVADALDAIGEDPAVHYREVERRHLITVVDDEGATVPDATVAVRAVDGRLITWGRTRADGRFAFFPRAYGSDMARYDLEVTVGDRVGAGIVADNEEVRVALNGPRPVEDAFRVDVAFIIDATGSMGEEIERIKQTISDIAERIGTSTHAPDLRLGLVAYRDRTDDFVTRTVDFTDDIEAFQGVIDELQANGGGDFPEELNAAMYAGMRRLSWRQESTLRLAFVVADAPAHHYEQQSYVYADALLDAATMGVKLFPIASGGSDPVAEFQFRQLAQFTLGHFIFITEGGGSPEGSGGSDYEVDPEDFRVERLDDLVVRLIADEMDAWHGVQPAPAE